MIKYRTGQYKSSFKWYVCVFVCFATKAVYLDVVEDIPTKAFFSALRRFLSRKEKLSAIYSVCGTFFKGANKETQKAFSQFKHNKDAQDFLGSEEIYRAFNPPGAPQFCGHWLSAMK